MTERARMLAVYRGEIPDRVPFFLDLSHWFNQRHKIPFDLSSSIAEPDLPLIEYHKKVGAGLYIGNLFSCHDTIYPSDVVETASKETSAHGLEIVWRMETPIGTIERRRRWEEQSYSWCISKWGICTEQDLRVFEYAMTRARYVPAFDRYEKWQQTLGDFGVLYIPSTYSAMGYLLSLWMGIERTIYATVDIPETMTAVVGAINENLLTIIDMLCHGPGEVIFMGDNFSSDIQSPEFFRRWSAPFYREAFRRIKAAGKYSAVHIDGRLHGLLREFSEIGADCIDAVTPYPGGDLTPTECREEAGPNLILSGGVPPAVWVETHSDDDFRKSVLGWLEIRKASPRLIAAAGDQVPPFAPEYRIEMMRELVDKFGKY
jgi:Uroporphyrinogen decarboxylase (URO-D)